MKKLIFTTLLVSITLLNSRVLLLPSYASAQIAIPDQNAVTLTPPATTQPAQSVIVDPDYSNPLISNQAPAAGIPQVLDQSAVNLSSDATNQSLNNAAQQQIPKQIASTLSDTSACSPLLSMKITKCMGSMMISVGGGILYIGGLFLNFSINTSVIRMSEIINKLGTINAAWKVFRDLANVFFIFMLIYIAMKTILGLASGETRKMLTHVIIVALLINFSLFGTKVVIDASNIVAIQFYNSITTGGNDADNGLSWVFMNNSKLTSIFQNVTEEKLASETNFLLVGFLSLIFGIILTISFVAIGILFLIRFAILIMLMILSPLAFLGYAMPPLAGAWEDWKKTLTREAIFAPFMMAMLWVVAAMSSGIAAGLIPTNESVAWSDAFAGKGGQSIYVIVNFALLIILLVAGMAMSKKFSGSAGGAVLGWSDKWSRKAVGGMTLGLGARVGRQTLGRGFNAVAESKTAQKMASSRNFLTRFAGATAIKASRGAASSNFDARAVGVGGLGDAGGKGGYSKGLADSIKAKQEFDKSLKTNIYADKETEMGVAQHEKTIVEKRNKIAQLQKDIAEAKKGDGETAPMESELAQVIQDRDRAAKALKDINDDRSLTNSAGRARAQNIEASFASGIVDNTFLSRAFGAARRKAREETEKDYIKGDTDWARDFKISEIEEQIRQVDRSVQDQLGQKNNANGMIETYQKQIAENSTKIVEKETQIAKNNEIIRKAEEKRTFVDPWAIRQAKEARSENTRLQNEKVSLQNETKLYSDQVDKIKKNISTVEQSIKDVGDEKKKILKSTLSDLKSKKSDEDISKKMAAALKKQLDDDKGPVPTPTPPPAPTGGTPTS
ncbi:MAG: hypothetical protein Q7S34_04535 [bacterium]|nr:hypothetical protein [bacterium]